MQAAATFLAAALRRDEVGALLLFEKQRDDIDPGTTLLARLAERLLVKLGHPIAQEGETTPAQAALELLERLAEVTGRSAEAWAAELAWAQPGRRSRGGERGLRLAAELAEEVRRQRLLVRQNGCDLPVGFVRERVELLAKADGVERQHRLSDHLQRPEVSAAVAVRGVPLNHRLHADGHVPLLRLGERLDLALQAVRSPVLQ